jgi:hypothetical protein
MLINFSISKVLFSLNSFHRAKQLTKLIMWNTSYWSGYVKICVEKSLELLPNDWIPQHDNAPAHKAPSVKQFLAKNRLLKWNTHPIPLIWLRMTSGCFQK